jgi:acetyl esterase/lipase
VKTTLPELMRREVGLALDPSRVVAFGQSSGGTLALHLVGLTTLSRSLFSKHHVHKEVAHVLASFSKGSLPDSPQAIAAFYAAAYFSDGTWSQPTPGSEMMPPIDRSFAQRVLSEPPRSMTVVAPEQFLAPGTMPMPDLSKPRDAWMALAFKEGTHLERCVQDGDFARVDPSTFFSSAFPPTIFLTGTKDTFIDPWFSRRAYEHLAGLGVDTKLILAEGGQHGFDFGLGRDEVQFNESVLPGYEFLAKHV